MKKAKIYLICAAALAVLFIIFTVCAVTVDVTSDGFEGSKLGFSSLNGSVYESVGKSEYFDKTSDAFLVLALLAAAVFAVCGAVQWIKRKKLGKVDPEILLLGAVYLLIAAFYVVFEVMTVNYRPGAAEASYPSTHTYIVITVALTAAAFAKRKLKDKKIVISVYVICAATSALTALCRLYSGKHWFTDIMGGVLLGGALTTLYAGLTACSDCRKDKGGSK